MKKKLKTVLFITDNWDESNFECVKYLCEPGNIYYNEESNHFKFDFSFVKKFSQVPDKNFDVVLVDYGIMRSERCSTRVLEKFYERGSVILWSGGFGDVKDKYNDDAQKQFPEEKFLHHLQSCTTGHEEILFALYQALSKKKLKEVMVGDSSPT
jgi:hypothetical protein